MWPTPRTRPTGPDFRAQDPTATAVGDFFISRPSVAGGGVEGGFDAEQAVVFRNALASAGRAALDKRGGGGHRNIRKGGVYTTKTDTWSLNKDKLSMEYVNNDLKDSDNIGAALMQDNGTLTTGGKAADPFGQMMLLPQTVDSANSVALKIEYQLKRQNAADWEDAELETVLPTGEWQPGKRYTYNVVLSSVTDITVYYIQTKVDQWGTPQVGGTVIIK